MNTQDLQAVITENRQRQEQARQLNIRAGQDTFKIMSSSEWQEWLTGKINGARRVAEIADLDALRLPALDSSLVMKVTSDNPETLVIEGNTLNIEYGKDSWGGGSYVRTSVEEQFARRTKVEVVKLPGGRIVDIHCNGHSAKTVMELVESLEQSRIERCWSEKRSEVEHTSWISNPEDVFPYLSKLLSVVEITRTNNGDGEPVLGYFSLYSDSDPDFQIRLKGSREEAEEQTKIGLERLIKKASHEALAIPQEEPWHKHDSWYGWQMTDLGQALKTRFETLVTEHAENLTSSNIEERFKALKQAVETAKVEIGGEHAEVKQLIETTEAEVDGKIQAIDNQSFVSVEIEQVREAIQKSKDNLKSAAYGDAKRACNEATSLANNLNQLYWDRTTELRKAEDERRKAEVRRQQIEEEIQRLDWPEAHLWVDGQGKVSVNCGKSSKMGEMYVSPSIGDRHYNGPSIDSDGRHCTWQQVPTGKQVEAIDYSGSGNINSRADFTVNDGDLKTGVWAVAKDGKGTYFYPVIHWHGDEVVPEIVTIVRERIVSQGNGTMADQLAALQNKFGSGGQNNNRQKSKKKGKNGRKAQQKLSAEPQQQEASVDALAALKAHFNG